MGGWGHPPYAHIVWAHLILSGLGTTFLGGVGIFLPGDWPPRRKDAGVEGVSQLHPAGPVLGMAGGALLTTCFTLKIVAAFV